MKEGKNFKEEIVVWKIQKSFGKFFKKPNLCFVDSVWIMYKYKKINENLFEQNSK